MLVSFLLERQAEEQMISKSVYSMVDFRETNSKDFDT